MYADLPQRGRGVAAARHDGAGLRSAGRSARHACAGLRLLRQRGHDVLVFHVMDDDELDFPFTGPTRFEGLESPDYLNCNPRALREGYLEAVSAFLDDARRQCARNTIDYCLDPHQPTAGRGPGHVPEQPTGMQTRGLSAASGQPPEPVHETAETARQQRGPRSTQLNR